MRPEEQKHLKKKILQAIHVCCWGGYAGTSDELRANIIDYCHKTGVFESYPVELRQYVIKVADKVFREYLHNHNDATWAAYNLPESEKLSGTSPSLAADMARFIAKINPEETE